MAATVSARRSLMSILLRVFRPAAISTAALAPIASGFTRDADRAPTDTPGRRRRRDRHVQSSDPWSTTIPTVK